MTRRHNTHALLHWNTVTIEDKPLYDVTHKTSYVVSMEIDNYGNRYVTQSQTDKWLLTVLLFIDPDFVTVEPR